MKSSSPSKLISDDIGRKLPDNLVSSDISSEYVCRCGKKIGDLMPHIKFPALQMLNLGNGNVAESYHGRCGVCGAGIHFDWRWELAARAFGSNVDLNLNESMK